MRLLLITFFLAFTLVLLQSCKEDEQPTEVGPGPDPNGELAILDTMKADEAAGTVKVMTRNIYIGTNVDVVLDAEIEDVPILVATAFGFLEKTDIYTRATALAKEIGRVKPHLVGLQEVTEIYIQSPSDFLDSQGNFIGNAEEANTLLYDYLDILLDALAAEDLNYEVASRIANANVELPMFVTFNNDGSFQFDDVRILDQDVILARNDVQTSKPKNDNYEAYLPVSEELGINVIRGYTSVEAKIGDGSYRFINTHLEAFDPTGQIRPAQAAELLAAFATEVAPIIMVGDFNSVAPSGTAYGMVIDALFTDVWDENTKSYSYNPNGYTFGHQADLANSSVKFVERIDFIFVRAPLATITYGPVVVFGDEIEEKVSGIFPSDHGGVVTLMKF